MELKSTLEKEKLASVDATQIWEPTNNTQKIFLDFQINGYRQECSALMIKMVF